MDKALVLFREEAIRIHIEMDRRILPVRELVAERFSSVELQFEGIEKRFYERDIRVNQNTEYNKTAIATALASQKEIAADHITALSAAINKSEQHTTNQLEQQRTVLISVEKTLSEKINDVSDRMNRWEGVGSGKGQISAPLWAMAASVLTALMIAGLMMLFDKPMNTKDSQPSINATNIADITRRLDSIEQTLLRQQLGKP
jgi:hypothetical protein